MLTRALEAVAVEFWALVAYAAWRVQRDAGRRRRADVVRRIRRYTAAP